MKTHKSLSAKYYQENKRKNGRKAHEGYQYFSKNKKRDNIVIKVAEDEKSKFVEYRKKIYWMRKNISL